MIWQEMETKSKNTFDVICGVPYAALPLTVSLSLESGVGMIMVRKEAKDHGKRQMIEGAYSKGNNCLIVEDVITTGRYFPEAKL